MSRPQLSKTQRQKESAKIAASVSAYYDSLSEKEMNEQQLWGRFSESQFPIECDGLSWY
jgi:hypothetical protein